MSLANIGSLGRFLLGILTDISKWFQDEQLFLQENRTKSGGNTVFLPGLQLRWPLTPKPVIAQEDLITWADFKQVVRKWHRKLYKVGIIAIDLLLTWQLNVRVTVARGVHRDWRVHAYLQCHHRPEGDSPGLPDCRYQRVRWHEPCTGN